MMKTFKCMLCRCEKWERISGNNDLVRCQSCRTVTKWQPPSRDCHEDTDVQAHLPPSGDSVHPWVKFTTAKCINCGCSDNLNDYLLCFKCHQLAVEQVLLHKDAKAKSEVIGSNLEQLPFHSLEAVGQIFAEGEKKYGRNNWAKGANNTDYQRERTRHAMRHLNLWANGDRQETHLAKVAWFCLTQLELERLQREIVEKREGCDIGNDDHSSDPQHA